MANDELGFDSIFAVSGDIHGISLPLTLAIISLILLIGIISSRAARSRNLTVRHLFMKVKINCPDHSSQTGYIRTLDPHHAVIVTSFAPQKGSSIELILGSLPNFPLEDASTQAVVKNVKAINGQPSTHIVYLEFAKKAAEKIKEPLAAYLIKLHA